MERSICLLGGITWAGSGVQPNEAYKFRELDICPRKILVK